MESDLISVWNSYLLPWGLNLISAALVFVIGRTVARWFSKLLGQRMTAHGLDELLVRLSSNTAYYVLMVIVILAALDQLGVDTTSALAALGAAGLAVGLALKDSLSNFAAGVMIVLFRPFRLGHFVEVAGTSGAVQDVGLFSTTLLTPDNKRVVIPNRLVYDDTIINYSAEDLRRVDMVFGIAYEDDMAQARKLIQAVLAADDRVLDEPAPDVAVSELADSSVNFVVRPWCKKGDYWDLKFSITEQIKHSFDQNGVSIPYPQRDVHMHEVKAA